MKSKELKYMNYLLEICRSYLLEQEAMTKTLFRVFHGTFLASMMNLVRSFSPFRFIIPITRNVGQVMTVALGKRSCGYEISGLNPVYSRYQSC